MTPVQGFGGVAAPTVFKRSTAVRSGYATQHLKVNKMNNLHFSPLNEHAHMAVKTAYEAIDGRLKLDAVDVCTVLFDALAQHHKPSVKLLGQAAITDALVKADVLGRVSDRSQFYVKDQYKPTYECAWQTKDADTDIHPSNYVKSKSGTLYRTRSSMLTLEYADVAALANYKCWYGKIVDLEASLGAFDNGAAPSVRFTSCQHLPASPERVLEFKEFLRAEAAKNLTFYAEIAEGGLVIQNLKAFQQVLATAAIRWTNNAFVRFALLTKDEWGRSETSYGCFGQHNSL